MSDVFEGLEFAPRIPVKDGNNAILYWTNPKGARRLAKKGVARLVGTRSKVRALEVIPRRKAGPSSIVGLGSEALHSPAYSHNHEVSETYLDEDGEIRHRHPLDPNPENVWTLRRLPGDTRDIYRAVILDCLVRPRAKMLAMEPRIRGGSPRVPKAA